MSLSPSPLRHRRRSLFLHFYRPSPTRPLDHSDCSDSFSAGWREVVRLYHTLALARSWNAPYPNTITTQEDLHHPSCSFRHCPSAACTPSGLVLRAARITGVRPSRVPRRGGCEWDGRGHRVQLIHGVLPMLEGAVKGGGTALRWIHCIALHCTLKTGVGRRSKAIHRNTTANTGIQVWSLCLCPSSRQRGACFWLACVTA